MMLRVLIVLIVSAVIILFWLRGGRLTAIIVALALGVVGFLGGSLAAGGICCGEHAVGWGILGALAGIVIACLPIAARRAGNNAKRQ
jgi:hypothetical protein